MSQQYETQKTACISTGHLPELEMRFILDNPNESGVIFDGEYGFIISTYWATENGVSKETPQFSKVMEWAVGEGIDWVNFDNAASEVSCLDTFDW